MSDIKSIAYKSIFRPLIEGYIEEKRSVGYKFIIAPSLLKRFDTLAYSEHCSEMILSKCLVLKWAAKKPNETEANRSHRISMIRGFAKYMARLDYQAFIFPERTISIARYSYVPYIFSVSELKKIFVICDSYPYSNASPYRHLMLSFLFRILYGCGLRISEALKLKFDDVDLKQGAIFIRDTKFGKERIVPMAKALVERARDYVSQIHMYQTSSPFLFPSPYGGRYNEQTIYKLLEVFYGKQGSRIRERVPGYMISGIHFPCIA